MAFEEVQVQILELNEDDINKALVKFNERIGCKIANLKPRQNNALLDVVNGHDVIAALPTGYGKKFAYEHACRVLGNLVNNGKKNPENARVVMYHASVEYGSENLSELIFHQISSEDSPLRIILASSALGMGADFGRVERIVHAGPPKSNEAYIQQVDRTGRTGKQATEFYFFNNSDAGRPEMNKTMKSFCRNESTCMRKILNDYFGFMDDTN
eukprot:XP_019927775.1 PREDICTED: uncharacterized protein LOC109620234 [Crassostrea gigas]